MTKYAVFYRGVAEYGWELWAWADTEEEAEKEVAERVAAGCEAFHAAVEVPEWP